MSAIASSGPYWILCDGRSLSKTSYPKLFAVIGNTFGGHSSTFNIPDLQNNTPIGTGTGIALTPRQLGEMGGQETVVLNISTIPSHSHTWMANGRPADIPSPSNRCV